MAEFDSKHAVICPEGVFIIGTYDENGVPNAMNAAWGQQSDYEEITFFLGKHKTTENLKKTGAFTVAYATVGTLEISDYFGVETGAHVNKIEKAGCHVHRAPHVNAPIIEEFPVVMECELLEFLHTDYVDGIVGKIVNVKAEEAVLSENGKVDPAKLNAIMFDQFQNGYYVTGEKVGKAWNAGAAIMKKNPVQ